MEAEIADLQSHISKLETDLSKVRMMKTVHETVLTIHRRTKTTSKIYRRHMMNIQQRTMNKRHVYSGQKRK
jgi:phosphoenolpyruvate carboxylase